MVLSEQQKKDLIERLKKGREQAKEKKLNEEATQKKTSKPKKAEPEPEPVKKTSSKKLEKVNDHESSSDTEKSIDDVPDVKPKVKNQSVNLEEAFDQMKVKSKPIDIPKKVKTEKDKPYLKIKLYKEPNNPNLINKFVNIINETEETQPIKKDNHQDVKKFVEPQPKEPEKTEREKHLEKLCRIYFN